MKKDDGFRGVIYNQVNTGITSMLDITSFDQWSGLWSHRFQVENSNGVFNSLFSNGTLYRLDNNLAGFFVGFLLGIINNVLLQLPAPVVIRASFFRLSTSCVFASSAVKPAIFSRRRISSSWCFPAQCVSGSLLQSGDWDFSLMASFLYLFFQLLQFGVNGLFFWRAVSDSPGCDYVPVLLYRVLPLTEEISSLASNCFCCFRFSVGPVHRQGVLACCSASCVRCCVFLARWISPLQFHLLGLLPTI